jgi:hypothetical protein
MRNEYYIGLLLLSVLACSAGCKKDPALTNNSVTGSAGTFSALVDGVPFASDPFSIDSNTGQYLGAFATRVPGILSQYQLSIIGQKNNPNDTGHTSITLFVSAATVQSYSSLNSQTGTDFCLLSYAHGIDSIQKIWLSDSSAAHAGNVTITTLDTVHMLVSGTFSFTGYSAGAAPATHTISQGVFKNVPIEP